MEPKWKLFYIQNLSDTELNVNIENLSESLKSTLVREGSLFSETIDVQSFCQDVGVHKKYHTHRLSNPGWAARAVGAEMHLCVER